MRIVRQQHRAPRGYSLVELLLTTALLLLFVGLGVVSIKTMSQGSALAEGTLRFETVLRFARAEAARSGHRVRVVFSQSTNEAPDTVSATNVLNTVKLVWEPDPMGQPGVFQDLLTAQWGVDQVNEMVGIEAVKLLDSTVEQSTETTNAVSVATENTAIETATATESTSPEILNEEPSTEPSCITFNPNGSCDSAEITIAGRSPGDDRRVVVKLDGFTGAVSRLDQPKPDPATSTEPDNKASSDLPL